MPDIFSTPDDNGDIQASELHSSLGEQLGAEAENALDPQDSLSAAWIYRRVREGIAGGYAPHDWDGLPGQAGITLDNIEDQARAQIPALPMDQAKQRVKDAGLDGQITLPSQDEIKQPVLDLMIQEAQERRDRQAAIARGPQGFYPDALGTITSIGAGMLDPVNAAAFSIPVVGEARWGKIIADAGDSIAARAALNAGKGAAQGAVGTAALQPADWWLKTRDGQDYTFADVLKQVTLGAAMGSVAHAGFGAIGDVLARRRGLPLPGSPADLLARGEISGVHVPGEALSEDGATADHVAEILGVPPEAPQLPEPDGQIHPAELYDDLPPAAQQDALRATMADVIDGQLPQPMEMLQVAADHSPRIAESIEAYHGSPHDFDRFDTSQIGTGERSQSYGHGLYFAQEENVASHYATALSTSPGPIPETIKGALKDVDYAGFESAGEAISNIRAHQGDWMSRWGVQDSEAAQAINKYIAENPRGNVYRVHINAAPDQFLDWDKPLSEQSPHVQAALAKLGMDKSVAANGEDAYRQLSLERTRYGAPDENGMRRSIGPQDAAGALRDAGIAGVKYLDQGSRDAGEGTRNFVVFNDKDVEITHKNGEPVKREDFVPSKIVNPKIPRGRAAADPQTWSLFEMLAHEGGLKPDPELEALFGNKKGPFVPGFGALVRPGGRTLDDALRLAKDQGYMFDAADVTGAEGRLTPNDLLDRLAEENAGRRQYRFDQQFATKGENAVAAEREAHEIISTLRNELETGVGIRDAEIDPRLERRVVEMMMHEGEQDVLAAYERAIVEDEERYNAEAAERDGNQDVFAQRNISDDGRSAPAGGGAAATAGSDARDSRSGSRGNAGAEPRLPGGGHGATGQAALARDQAFAQLGNRLPAYDAPEEVENSRWADNLPEPASLDPKRSAAALKLASAEAEQIWRDLEPYLSEEERRVFADRLEAADRDAAANLQVLKDGAACLAAAVG